MRMDKMRVDGQSEWVPGALFHPVSPFRALSPFFDRVVSELLPTAEIERSVVLDGNRNTVDCRWLEPPLE